MFLPLMSFSSDMASVSSQYQLNPCSWFSAAANTASSACRAVLFLIERSHTMFSASRQNTWRAFAVTRSVAGS